jgi:hypothetical protein
MTRSSAITLRLAALRNAASSPLAPHHRLTIQCRSYGKALTEGDIWFLDSILKLSSLRAWQQQRLHEIASSVERGRR